jgi:hypothetical protein
MNEYSGRTASQNEIAEVAKTVFPIKDFPIAKYAMINTGKFKQMFVTQSGTPPGIKLCVTAFIIIEIPVNPPTTRPFGSKMHLIAKETNAVPSKMYKYIM